MARPRVKASKRSEPPEGLVYRPDLLSPDEERAVLDVLGSTDFHAVTMRGQTARRTVRHYGLDYDYERYGRLLPTDPLPEALTWLRDRCAELADVPPDDLAQTLVSRYPPGAPIGWHRDAPMFGIVLGVSLLAPSRMRFQRTTDDVREVYEIELEPRSGYVLAGEVRTQWQHSIPPVKELRYSITFRTLKNPDRWRETA
jgi:alkylated DNA repair dioxygenase AlkB